MSLINFLLDSSTSVHVLSHQAGTWSSFFTPSSHIAPPQTHTTEMSVIVLGGFHCHLLSTTGPPVLPQALVTSCSDHVGIILSHSTTSPPSCSRFNPFTVQLWLYHSLLPNLTSLLFHKGEGLNPLDLHSKPCVCSPCSVLSPTDPNRKHTAPVPFSKAYLKVLFPCPLLFHFPHLKCPSSSYLHLEILAIFQGPTQTPPPLGSFSWSFSEVLSPSSFLLQLFAFSSCMACAMSLFFMVFLLIEDVFIFVATTKLCPEWELHKFSLSEWLHRDAWEGWWQEKDVANPSHVNMKK